MTYVDFIEDSDFLDCVGFLIHSYDNALQGITFDKFFKNRIDTFKMSFDKVIYNYQEQNWVAAELQRQVEKTVTNDVGKFHEKLIGSVRGYTNYAVGNSYDIAADDRSLFAEIKNKHNTLTGTHVPALFNKMSIYADQNPEATCYYVRIIDTKSRDELWKFSSGPKDLNTGMRKSYEHPRIRIISGDRFWSLITGIDNAFKQICDVLPEVINDYISQNSQLQVGSSMGLFSQLYTQSQKNNRTLFEEITYINYQDKSKYEGY